MVVVVTDVSQPQVRLQLHDFVLDPKDPDVMRRVLTVEADVLTFDEGTVSFWLRGVEVAAFPWDAVRAVELPSSAPAAVAGAYSVDEVRKRHGNAYQRWTQEDDELLVELHSSGHDVEALAERFSRQPSAIRSRLMKLGVDESAGQEDSSAPPFRRQLTHAGHTARGRSCSIPWWPLECEYALVRVRVPGSFCNCGAGVPGGPGSLEDEGPAS